MTNFPDVSENDWFYPGVVYVSDNGIMTGYENGNFGPNDGVNRAQLATILQRVDAAMIDNMFVELQALRMYDTNLLTGTGWDNYKAEFERYPVNGIEAGGEGIPSYETVKPNLDVVATDGSIEVLSWGSGDFFYIQQPSEYSIGVKNVFGPFMDDVDTIVNEIN